MSLHLISYGTDYNEQVTIDKICLNRSDDQEGCTIVIDESLQQKKGDLFDQYLKESYTLTSKIYKTSDEAADQELTLYNGLDILNKAGTKCHRIFEVKYRLILDFDARLHHKNLSLDYWKRLVVPNYGDKIIKTSLTDNTIFSNPPSRPSTSYSTKTAIQIIGCLISDKFIENWSAVDRAHQRGDSRALDKFHQQTEKIDYLNKYFQLVPLNDDILKELKIKLDHQFVDDRVQINPDNFYMDGDGTSFRFFSTSNIESLDPLTDASCYDSNNMNDLLEQPTWESFILSNQNYLDLSYLFTEQFINEHLLTKNKKRQYKTFAFITIISNIDESSLLNRRQPDYLFLSNIYRVIHLNAMVKTKNDRQMNDEIHRQAEYYRFKKFDKYFQSSPIINQIYKRLDPHNGPTKCAANTNRKRRTFIKKPPKILKEGTYLHHKNVNPVIIDIM